MNFNMVGTVTSTSSQAINLINYAMSFDSFHDSDYVIFNDSEYSYYIVWGKLENENGQVTGDDVEYIHYYRTSTSGYTSNYVYEVGSDTSFVLSLSSEYVPTSNVTEVGFVSQQVVQNDFTSDIVWLLTFGVAFLFVIMMKQLRGIAK